LLRKSNGASIFIGFFGSFFIGFFIDFLDLWRIELQHPGCKPGALPLCYRPTKRWEGEQTACLPVGRGALPLCYRPTKRWEGEQTACLPVGRGALPLCYRPLSRSFSMLSCLVGIKPLVQMLQVMFFYVYVFRKFFGKYADEFFRFF
jgi:hypothetical protein